MNVLKEIFEWSNDRPEWQRDALRRLIEKGDLSDTDVRELVQICKSVHGLAESAEVVVLQESHLPQKSAGSAPVVLDSIFHHRGVNALAENQTLHFGPGLTIVYGDNAAGKTGYIRILKSACRARGQEKILGNVVSGTTPPSLSVEIKYKVGSEQGLREWSGKAPDPLISRVSVFDTQCAAVYLTQKTDVAFRPFGLDFFDKLVKTCKAVRSTLESEQRALSASKLMTLQIQIPEGTAVAKLLASLSSLTRAENVRTLAQLSPEENAKLLLLEKSLLDLHANDPKKLSQQLTLRASRMRSLAKHLQNVEGVLSRSSVAKLFSARNESQRKTEEAQRLRALTFPEGTFQGTGSESWLAIWESARAFSETSAYPDKVFPFVEDGAQCVFCQQKLDKPAIERLKKFQAFVISSAEKELRELRSTFAEAHKTVVDLKLLAPGVEEGIKEIRIEQEDTADKIASSLELNEARKRTILSALSEGKDAPETPELQIVSRQAEALAEQLDERVKTLSISATEQKRKEMLFEAQELRARKLLGNNVDLVLNEIERKTKVAAYELCINDTKTQSITQKSTSVTRTAVTQRLKATFQKELSNLEFRHVEVELREIGGAEGVLYHKLALTRAPGVELPQVVSEGEQRCLSIAAFFAELSTADDPSGIVFDDPVSSLDYKWREGVARRLVTEAKTRQVIVFTHDLVFLFHLRAFAEEQGVEFLDQHVRQLSVGAGVCTEETPWVALPVKKKIGYLKKEWQSAEKLHRGGHQSAYEKEAKLLYGLLRETWERALEEVLLNGIVERFRPSVQTQQIRSIANITDEDCVAVEAAMTNCSKWLTGHDQAAAARAEVPTPDILKANIESLENWVAAIRKRREKKQ